MVGTQRLAAHGKFVIVEELHKMWVDILELAGTKKGKSAPSPGVV